MNGHRPQRRAARGFTLIEVMFSVAIVGMLSSVAIPNYIRVQMRARTAERAAVMTAISTAVTDIVQHQQRTPANGDWNPNVAPDGSKHRMNWGIAGWNEIPMIVEGDTYYSYRFTISDGSDLTPAVPLKMIISARGDLDADGTRSTRVMTFASYGEGFRLVDDTGEPADIF